MDDDEGSSRSCNDKIRRSECPGENTVHGNRRLTSQSCRRRLNIHWFMLYNYIRRFRNASWLVIRSSNVFPSAKTPPARKIRRKSFQNCHYRWRVVGYVYDAETSNNLHSGRIVFCLAPRKHDKFGRESKQCWLFSDYLIETLCIINSLLMIRQFRFLSGGSENSPWCGTKKTTWTVDCAWSLSVVK